MKKLFTLSLLLAASLLSAHAQYVLAPSINGGTFNIAASTTNTTIGSSNLAVIVATRAIDIAIQPQFKLTGAGTSPVVLKFDESIDNSNWTVATRSITITPSGTTLVSKMANFTVGAAGYLRLSQIENPNAEAVTNLVIKYAQKEP